MNNIQKIYVLYYVSTYIYYIKIIKRNVNIKKIQSVDKEKCATEVIISLSNGRDTIQQSFHTVFNT